MAINVTSNVIGDKINRYLGGEKLRVLDLFSGCGGLSLGFQGAGYSIVGSVEIDKDAAKSHALNFHKNNDYFESHAQARDIEKTNALELLNDFGIKSAIDRQIDVIIGGPPCQAFTRIGRAKLREVKQDSDAFLNDARSQLYKRYLKYVRDLQPLAILMENVPDMLNYGGTNIAELVCDDLSTYGYQCRYSLLNSAYYGIPQMRERMFLIAIHNSLATDITFPAPTHYIKLPRGYNGSRNVALKNIELNNPGHYVPIVANSKLPRALSAQDALSDLPVLLDHLKGNIKKGEKKLRDPLPYSSLIPKNQYQQIMREWPGYNSESMVNANVIRVLPRDYPIFGLMAPGDQYPEAHKIAELLLESKITELGMGANKKLIDNLRSRIVPPYDVTKFPNKWRKMEANMPSRTLMAHLGKDSYSHIHYDSNQARTITVREAARLQSFPDGFVFSGAMNSAFRQIGNAVPPLLAIKLAEAISKMVWKGVAQNENPISLEYS